MAFLSAGLFPRGFPHLRDLLQPVTEGRLAAVAAVFIDKRFQLLNPFLLSFKLPLLFIDEFLLSFDLSSQVVKQISNMENEGKDRIGAGLIQSKDLLPGDVENIFFL